MIDLRIRSRQKELIDRDDIPFKDIVQNLKELDLINSLLGGHNITIKGFKKLAGSGKNISVCEIGCGGGDNLKAISRYCIKNNIDVSLSGIDINPQCIAYAEKNTKDALVKYWVSDYKLVEFENKPDIIFASLFCHHFGDEELISMMQWMQQNSKTGFFINDLHRNWLAYYSIKIISRLFSRSYMVKNDAPLSVTKGFTKNEWNDIISKTGINNFTVEWKWAFRHLVTAPLTP
jgi:2-polyprenyl-3-methyl-5-hydroxy-6-metoxy-1,4-benzoquinol methylase